MIVQKKSTEEYYEPYLETMGIQYNQIMFNLTSVSLVFLAFLLFINN